MPEQNEGYQPNEENQGDARREGILEIRDRYKEAATDTQKGVAESQAARYETILYRLMNRTDTNVELVNAMKKFIDTLEHASMMGTEDKKFHPKEIEELTSFFTQEAEHINENLETGTYAR